METIQVRSTGRRQFVDITAAVRDAVRKSGVSSGIAVLFVPHTTAGITVNENADPDVKRDIAFALERAVPDRGFAHAEGNSDAHAKAVMTGFSLNLIVENGQPVLGTWQDIYLCEYDGPRNRKVFLKILEERSE